MSRLAAALGLLVFVGLARACAPKGSPFPWRTVLWGFGLQIVLALLIFGLPAYGIPGPLKGLFMAMDLGVAKVLGAAEAGSDFLFGPLVDESKTGYVFAFRVLPTIVFFSSLVALLYHLGVLQRVVEGMAWVMRRTMGCSGAESLSSAANIFLGQTEAPLLVRPFVARMTRSELLCVMVGGMANVAGGVLAAFVGMLSGLIPNIAGHLIAASVMSAPVSILVAKLMLPETEVPQTRDLHKLDVQRLDANSLEAVSRGASEGLLLALNVGAMLLAFISMVALLNALLGFAGEQVGWAQFSLQKILGTLLAPMAWLMGVPWNEAATAGSILGEKVVLNEFVAYVSLAQKTSELSPRTLIILSYALCGFANFASIGIQLGGIGSMAPERRGDLARLGLRAVLGGNLASFLSACTVAWIL